MSDVLTEEDRALSERALRWLRVAAADGGSVTLSPPEALALDKRLRLAEAAAAPKPAPASEAQTAPVVPRVVGGEFEPLTDAERQKLRVGDHVAVEMDDGTVRRFDVRHEPWTLGHGCWLIGLAGVPGGYDLSRVRGRRK